MEPTTRARTSVIPNSTTATNEIIFIEIVYLVSLKVHDIMHVPSQTEIYALCFAFIVQMLAAQLSKIYVHRYILLQRNTIFLEAFAATSARDIEPES